MTKTQNTLISVLSTIILTAPSLLYAEAVDSGPLNHQPITTLLKNSKPIPMPTIDSNNIKLKKHLSIQPAETNSKIQGESAYNPND